jgi:hypothetical protein
MRCKASGEHSLGRTEVFEWHLHFRAGWVSAEDYEHSGRPSITKTAENVAKLREPIHEDRRRTIHDLRHSWDQLWSMPGDLNRKPEHAQHAKFVPRLSTNYKKQWNVNVSWAMRQC